MKGIGSESLVPQPTYQTVPTIGYNQVSPHYTQPYSFWTDPNAFDIPPEAVSQIDPNTLPVVSVPPINNVPQVSPSFIDLNSLPSVNVPQMSAADATAAGNLLSTGLNLQTPDWNSLIKGAGAMAASQYGPMVQSIAQQAKNAANTIQGYTQGAQGVLQDTARDINQSYAQSIAAQKGLDQGIVNMMSAANPNAVQQPMLNAQGIDPTTQAQIQAQNNQSFNAGGAALGSIGQLNANSLLAQSAAVQNYVRSIRPQIAIGGQQALQNVATGASSDLAMVATQEAKDAWQMAKDMGASDQKAGAAYQNAFNTTMSNFYKGAGLDVSAQGKNQATALSAGKTNVGTDITAQKANQTTDLAGQKANQATDLAGQKANQAVDYGAAKANASEANSILKGNQSAGTRIATIDMTTAAGIEKLNVTNDLNAKIHNQGAALSADKANQNAIVQNNYHNAQIYMQGVKTAISAQQAATSRGRLALELYKVTHPTASASAVASAGKSARSFFAPAAGYVPMSYATVPHTNPNTGAITHDRVPIYSHMTYEQMIQNFAESNGGTQDAYSYATNVANSYVNPGYKGRPLDADMANALSQANIDPTIQQTNKGVPYLTQQQAQYLNDNGFASFTHYLDQVPHYENGVHDRVFVIPPLMGAPPPQVTQAAG
jgi:hypothetical protein